jgi:hypothetical protein
MKPMYKKLAIGLAIALLFQNSLPLLAQDSTKKDLIVTVGYFNVNNNAAYLMVRAKTKINGKFQPAKGVKFNLFMDKDSAASATGKGLVTNEKGEAGSPLSPNLKDQWNSAATHTFIAITDGDAVYNPAKAEAPVTKAHLQIDTADGRTITASLLENKNGQWVPVKAVEIKVAIRRLQSDLAVSDKESYTSDSTGKVEAEFKRDSLPGDLKGMLTLVAKVEDNDTYGNLIVEKKVPWGSILKAENNFNKRTLYSTRFKTPIWLLVMAYSIIISVWSVIFYLIFQIVKIKKIGVAS